MISLVRRLFIYFKIIKKSSNKTYMKYNGQLTGNYEAAGFKEGGQNKHYQGH